MSASSICTVLEPHRVAFHPVKRPRADYRDREVLREALETAEVERCPAEHDIVNSLAFERFQDLLWGFVIQTCSRKTR